MYCEALGAWYNILEGTGRASRTYQKKLGWTQRQDRLGIIEAVIRHNRGAGMDWECGSRRHL